MKPWYNGTIKKKLYHKKGEPRKFRPKAKHPIKVYVWAGISKFGATNCVLSPALWMLNSTQEFCKLGYYPSLLWNFLVETFVFSKTMIQNILAELQFLTHTYKPKNKEELLNGIMEFWRTKMTAGKSTRYINHLHCVVIAKNGEAVEIRRCRQWCQWTVCACVG